MKKIFLFICIITMLILVGCNNTPTTGGNNDYPTGAEEIKVDNFNDYFDVKVTTDISENYFEEDAQCSKQTKAVSYVAFIPKTNYSAVVVELKFQLNSKISIGYSNIGDPVNSSEQTITLNNGITNKSFTITKENDYTYKVVSGSNNITITSVTGYVMPGKDIYELNEYENALQNQTLEDSNLVKNELETVINNYKNKFNNANSYKYTPTSYYEFKSIYGTGRDATNEVNLGNNGYSVDIENKIYSTSLYNYYVKNDSVYRQYKNQFGLVEENIEENMKPETFISEISPSFEGLFDENAIYEKNGNEYYGYITLDKMANDNISEYFKSHLQNYNITSNWDKFVVKYSFLLVDESFLFEVELHYANALYPNEYYDNTIVYGFKISSLNKAQPTIYVAGKDSFALEDNKEDALKYLTGLVEVDSNTTKIKLSTCNTHTDEPSSRDKNYLPIRIKESGIYEFYIDGRKIDIYSAETDYTSQYYYNAGLYYYYESYVPYGKTDITIQVVGTELNDYADMNNPLDITGNTIDIYLENVKDKQAFKFVPAETGLYEFIFEEHYIRIYAYTLDDFNSYFDATSYYHSIYFEEGKQYILTVDHSDYDIEILSTTIGIDYVGMPNIETPEITSEPTEVLFGNNLSHWYFDIATAGYYILNVNQTGGYGSDTIHICDEYGDTYGVKEVKVTLLDGTKAFYLTEGRHYARFDITSNSYFKGTINYELKVPTLIKEQEVILSFDNYVEVSETLPTIGSKLTIWFEITEKCNLLSPTTGLGRIYYEDGRIVQRNSSTNYIDVFHNSVECYCWKELEPGKYYMISENIDTSGSSRTVKESFRLQKLDEDPLQFYYMQAHPEVSREDITIKNYYFKYWGYELAIYEVAGQDYGQELWTETIGTYEFKYSNSNRILAYKDGKLITLTEMYESWPEEELRYREDAIKYFYEKHLEFYSELYE